MVGPSTRSMSRDGTATPLNAAGAAGRSRQRKSRRWRAAAREVAALREAVGEAVGVRRGGGEDDLGFNSHRPDLQSKVA